MIRPRSFAELARLFTDPRATGSPYGVTPIMCRCRTCGAVVMPEDRDTHANWHETSDPDSTEVSS